MRKWALLVAGGLLFSALPSCVSDLAQDVIIGVLFD
jgi:hypothetical protein